MRISFRTRHLIEKPRESAISEQCGLCDITVDNFKILDTAKEVVDLRILI